LALHTTALQISGGITSNGVTFLQRIWIYFVLLVLSPLFELVSCSGQGVVLFCISFLLSGGGISDLFLGRLNRRRRRRGGGRFDSSPLVFGCSVLGFCFYGLFLGDSFLVI
jgi:hypothetical protein